MTANASDSAANPSTPAATPGTDRSQRWVSATKDARDAIKWLATAIGAAAAVAFGAGPFLTSTSLDIDSWPWWRFGLYIVSALVGALGVTYIVWSLLSALIPRPVTINQLSPSQIMRFDALPDDYYPGDIQTMTEFRERFAVYRRAASHFRALAAQESDAAERAKLEALAETNRRNIEALRTAEAVMIEQIGFEVTQGRVERLKWPIALGVTIAIVGAACFQLTISGDDTEEADDTASLGMPGSTSAHR